MRILAVCLCLCIAAANACAAPERVAPGTEFPSKLINVRSPESQGWVMTTSPASLAFGRAGPGGGTDVAMVGFFQLEPASGADAFVELIRRNVEKDTDPDRHPAISPARYGYTEERGYPCVRYDGQALDLKRPHGLFKKEYEKLQIRALYCRHPWLSGAGFIVSYSHRGLEPDGQLEALADRFIQGVQVPPAAAAPAAPAAASQPPVPASAVADIAMPASR